MTRATLRTETLPLERVNRLVLRKQHLAAEAPGRDVLEVVGDLAGLHAQVPATPYLSLFARVSGFERERLERELYGTRRLVKVRGVRQTVFVVPRALLPVLWAVTHAQAEQMSERYMTAQGISRPDFERWSKAIVRLLAGQELTVTEIRTRLGARTSLSAIVNLLCDQSVLLRGRPAHGWKDGTPRYVVWREALPDVTLGTLEEGAAVTQLVERYLRAFGPVTETDVTWWTGLGKTRVRAALKTLEQGIVPVRIGGLNLEFMLLRTDLERLREMPVSRGPSVALLPVLDAYVMGYKDRGRYLDPAWTDFVFDRAGNATSTITVDGRIVGVWDLEDARPPVVKLFTFERLEGDVMREVRAKASSIGQFITDAEVELEDCRSMVSLRERSAGGFMSPLRGSPR